MGLQSLVPHKNRHATGGSDALSPSDIGAQPAGAYATLDSNNKLTLSQLPDLAVTEFLGACANQAEMLAKTGQKGDWVTRSDDGKVYVITGGTPSQASSWTALVYPVASSQVNSDWNATSGAAEILNKPTIPALTTSTAPANLAATAAVGTSGEAARADHEHPLPTAEEVGAAPLSQYLVITGDAGDYVGTYAFTGGFSGRRPIYKHTTLETVFLQYNENEGGESGYWAISDDGEDVRTNTNDAFDPSKITNNWRQGMVVRSILITRWDSYYAVLNKNTLADPVVQAATELRTEEDSGVRALVFSSEDDSWHIHEPENFRAAIDAAKAGLFEGGEVEKARILWDPANSGNLGPGLEFRDGSVVFYDKEFSGESGDTYPEIQAKNFCNAISALHRINGVRVSGIVYVDFLNGFYQENGTENGRARYTKSAPTGDLKIYWDSTRWVLSLTNSNTDPIAIFGDNTDHPWEVDGTSWYLEEAPEPQPNLSNIVVEKASLIDGNLTVSGSFNTGKISMQHNGDTLEILPAEIRSSYNNSALNFEEGWLEGSNGTVFNWGGSGELSVENRVIKNLGAPVDDNDAVRKIDLDAKAALTNTTPENLAATAAVGTSTKAARADHVHARPTAAAIGAAEAVHTHSISDTTGLQSALDAKVSNYVHRITGEQSNVAQAAMELRSMENGTTLGMRYDSTVETIVEAPGGGIDDPWIVASPTAFRAAIGAAPSVDPTFTDHVRVEDQSGENSRLNATALSFSTGSRYGSTPGEPQGTELIADECRLLVGTTNVLSWEEKGVLGIEDQVLRDVAAPAQYNDALRLIEAELPDLQVRLVPNSPSRAYTGIYVPKLLGVGGVSWEERNSQRWVEWTKVTNDGAYKIAYNEATAVWELTGPQGELIAENDNVSAADRYDYLVLDILRTGEPWSHITFSQELQVRFLYNARVSSADIRLQPFGSNRAGLVPGTASGDEVKFLSGNGSWASVPPPAGTGLLSVTNGVYDSPQTVSDRGLLTRTNVETGSGSYFARSGNALSQEVGLGLTQHQVVLANDTRLQRTEVIELAWNPAANSNAGLNTDFMAAYSSSVYNSSTDYFDLENPGVPANFTNGARVFVKQAGFYRFDMQMYTYDLRDNTELRIMLFRAPFSTGVLSWDRMVARKRPASNASTGLTSEEASCVIPVTTPARFNWAFNSEFTNPWMLSSPGDNMATMRFRITFLRPL